MRITRIRDALYSKYEPARRWPWIFAIISGIAFAILGAYLESLGTLPYEYARIFSAKIAGILAEGLVVAGLVTLLFGEISRRDNFVTVEIAITRVLHEVLSELSTELILDAYDSYDWKTTLSSARADDGTKIYKQETEINFSVHSIPRQLVIVAVTDSSLLKSYMLDDRCLLRWEVAKQFHNEISSALKPLAVFVNGKRARKRRSITRIVPNGTIVEHLFDVPSDCLAAEFFNVRFEFELLRADTGPTHVITPTLYRPALTATFNLKFNIGDGPTKVLVHDTGVSPLTGAGTPRTVIKLDPALDRVQEVTTFIEFPVHRRSQLLFEIFLDDANSADAETPRSVTHRAD